MSPPLGIRDVCGRGRVEFALEVPVAEPVDGEVAGQHRGEQVGGVRVDRVEGGNAGCRDGLAQGVEFGSPERDGILKPITVLPAPTAKGLEFDAVVVVEPAVIAGDTARGLRLLYVALTRPIQHLTVVHAQPLPDALRADLPVRR